MMAVQAGCGFKPPTPVFAVPLPVSGEPPPLRADMTSSPPPQDSGTDVIMAGRRSGQWVTLSKALLLQLVERICQLSFQTDVVTSSNASSRLYRKSSDEVESELETDGRRRSSSSERSGSRSEQTYEKHNEQNVMEDSTAAEESRTPLCQNDTLPDYDQTISGSGDKPADANRLAVSCCDGDGDSEVELEVDEANVNAETAPADCGGARGSRDFSTSDGNQLNDRHHFYPHHRRHQRSACRRRLLRTRRRKKVALATSSGQVRYQRRADDTPTGTGRRPHLHGVRRGCRQSWMALSKDIVYGAVESELRHVEGGTCRSLVPALSASSPAKSAAIWNPATCLSPSEKRRSFPSYSDLDCTPTLPDFRYRDVMFHHPGSDVISRPCDAPSSTGSSSSMLSELLGFGSAAPAVLFPADVVLTRQRHCSYSGSETTAACDVISPSVVSGSGVNNSSPDRPVADSSGHDNVTAALNYCIRRDARSSHEEVAGAVHRIWRPVESQPAKAATRCAARPRWVAIDKGDVCSLVDNLVLTMIASEDRGAGTVVGSGTGDVRDASTLSATPQLSTSSLLLSPSASSSRDKPAMPVSARCSVAATEPRKWKSDLLQRMRNEDT